MNSRLFRKLKPRSIFDKIFDNKLIFISTILVFLLLTIFYIIFSNKEYKTDATIEVTPKANKILNQSSASFKTSIDFIRNIQTQIDFLKSRYLVKKVATKLKSNINFLQKNSFTYERIDNNSLFKLKTFTIIDDAFYNRVFKLVYINEKQFTLFLLPKFKPQDEKNLEKGMIYEFGKDFSSKYFSFHIEKGTLTKKREIYFKVFDINSYVNRMIQNLSVYNSSLNSGMISLDYYDTTKSESQRFLNTLVLEFLTINKKNQLKDVISVIDMLDSKIEQEKLKLSSLQEKLEKYATSNNSTGLQNQTSQTINIIYNYENDLENLNLKKQKLMIIENLLRDTDDYEIVLAQLGELKNSSLSTLTNLIQEDKKNLENLKMKYKEVHPDVQKLQKSLDNKIQSLKLNITQMISDLKQEYKKKNSYLDKYKANLESIPKKEIGYNNLKLEYNFLEKSYLFLLNKKNQLLIEKNIKGDYTYKIIDFAYQPKYISKPKKKILLPLSLLLGMIFGVIFVLIKEYFNGGLNTPSEIEGISKFPLIGTIPIIPSKMGKDLVIYKNPDTLASKMLWSLRGTIENFLPSKDEANIITISSTIKGEGKTTIGANLGLAFGMGDKKTLIISMDFRLPQLHQKYGIFNDKGFSSLLLDDMNTDEVTYQLKEFNNFYFIPSGGKSINPQELINSKKVDKILSSLKKEYDYILIDLPPISVAPESIDIMKKADLNLIILKANYSQKSFLNYIEDTAEKNSIKNIALVANSIKNKYINIVSRKENQKYIYQNS